MTPPREGWEIMLTTYIVALIFIVILLFGALRAYQFLRLPRGIKAPEKTPHVTRTSRLHDLIFSKEGRRYPEE
jgi:hypothetical protein